MPIYEYECRGCHTQFELLVLRGTVPACPSCQGEELERLPTAFGVTSPETTRARIKAARQAARNDPNYKDKKIAEAEHIREHVQEHRDRVRND